MQKLKMQTLEMSSWNSSELKEMFRLELKDEGLHTKKLWRMRDHPDILLPAELIAALCK